MAENLDPRINNLIGTCYGTGRQVEVTFHDEVRQGFIAKQLDNRTFLVKLNRQFNFWNDGKLWLKVCRDFAHQSVKEI